MRNVSQWVVSFIRSKAVKAVVFGVLVFALVFGGLFVPGSAKVAQAACTTYTNIRVVDEGGGTVTNRNYFLYVYGTTQGGGTTYVWQMFYLNGKPAWAWSRTSFVAVGLADNNRALKIGVSTAWAYANPGWQNRWYQYVRC